MRSVPAVVACYALKGGVGKTAASVNVAWLASEQGHRTLLWDLDPQAAATFLLRTKAKVKGGARKLLQGHSDVRDAIKATDFDHLDLLPAEVLITLPTPISARRRRASSVCIASFVRLR